ncbi:diguanylate cyclase [Azohydromonas sp.]|uniref:diguanylate cyclase domain-containing protein n=1 Tax=Azohydromonas sp. TaxID=1872666 RepID=UPI002B6284C8|nr:diguanylate cyclase [Azohydromonas sp.]HMM85802.1 diguanylate cyclase [Azohydromonas sp.]
MDADLFVSDEAAPGLLARWRARLAAWRPRRWLGTLKARLAAGVLAVMFAGMAWTSWQMGRVAELQIVDQAHRREQIEAQRTAGVIARRVAELQRALAVSAEQLDAGALDDPRRLAELLEHKTVLRAMFSQVFVADATGRVVLRHDGAGGPDEGGSVAHRVYFQRALAGKLVQTSEPLRATASDEPMVVFAHPLTDADGAARGVVGGAMRLASRDLLAGIADSRDDEPGDPGELVVVTDGQGRILAHPQQARLLGTLADEPRLAQAHAQWVADGRPLLRGAGMWRQDGEVVGMAGDSEAGWHVWRATPTARLFAPLQAARTQALRHGAVAAALLALLLLGYLAWQLRPLAVLERRAAALLHGNDDGDWPRADGEIGQLARTLRHVWAERAQMESFNAEVLRKLGSVMAAAPVGLAFTRRRRFEIVSTEFCALVGRLEDELVGQPAQRIFPCDSDARALDQQVAATFARGQPYVGEWQLQRADGTAFWAQVRARPVDPRLPAAGTIWSVSDISEQVHSRQQLEHAALHDALTGVANRKGFDRALAQVFGAAGSVRPAAIVMIDLDQFKPINDGAGHAAGDRMLVAVAQAIAAVVRASDTVARLGGDEFAVLLPHCDQAQALVVADKVRYAICTLALPWQGRLLRVGASLGVAELGAGHDDPAQWLADADDACYAAKRSGGGAVRGRSPLRLVASDG